MNFIQKLYSKRKKNPFTVIKMECGFESCPAVYIFSSTNKLEITSRNKLCFQVHQGGPILHHKGDKKTSHISRQARIDIAKKLFRQKS